ncbi:MAG TPA: hypothetical protein ENI23_16385 [bacterium]|nr:hypothetical protein [bacterium]
MSKLAKGWKKEEIASLCQKPQYGYTSKSENRQNNNPKYFRTTDITKEKFDWDSVPYCIAPVKNEERYLIRKGDIFITRAGSVGENILIKDTPPRAVFASYLIRIKSLDRISNLYLSYYFQSPFFWNYIAEKKDGITTPNVNAQKLANIEVPYPESKGEQNLIIEEIETQFTHLDAAVKFLNAVKKKLDVYRNGVLKAAFKGELTKLQGGLVDRTLSEEFEIIMGQSPKSKYYNKSGEGLPFFQGKKEFSKLYPKIETWSTKASKIAGKGDVLLSIRAPIGSVNIAPSKCGIGRGLAAIKPNEKTRSKLIFYLLQILRNELKKKGTGTTFKAITKPNLYSLSIKLPKTKKDRGLLLKKIEFHFSVIGKIEQAVDSALLKSEQLRKSILKSAFEGRLVKYEGGSHD